MTFLHESAKCEPQAVGHVEIVLQHVASHIAWMLHPPLVRAEAGDHEEHQRNHDGGCEDVAPNLRVRERERKQSIHHASLVSTTTSLRLAL